MVKCPKEEEGCQWEGRIGDLEGHEGHCKFTIVPCPNKCMIDEIVQKMKRIELDDHLAEKCLNREYMCEHCQEKKIYSTHFQNCPCEETTCTNMECNRAVKRIKLDHHFYNECEHTLLRCKFSSIGCDVKLKRKYIKIHQRDDKAHLSQAIDTVVKLRDESKRKIFIFKLTDFQKKKDDNTDFITSSFYTNPKGYNMAIKVCVNGEGDGKGRYISVYTLLQKGDHDGNLSWPFVGEVTITLLNQLEDRNHHTMLVYFTPDMKSRIGDKGWGYSHFIPHSELSDDPESCTYLKDDALFFRVSVRAADHKSWLDCTI